MLLDTKHIFFYCYPQGPPEKAGYQHTIVCLAEGFKELGIPFYSDKNYWRTSPYKDEYLFNYDPGVRPNDCSIVVVNSVWLDYGQSLPDNLFCPNRAYLTVYIDSSDQDVTHSWKSEFRHFDLILKTHFNSKCKYPANMHPWAFGLSNRMLHCTNTSILFNEKQKKFLFNFRVSHPVREIAEKKFLPYIKGILSVDSSIDTFDASSFSKKDYLWWVQTGRRHYPNYFEHLKASAACACFGGNLLRPWPRAHAADIKYWHRALNKLFPKSRRVLQWDSWRFWESLAAGCVAFHVDFEEYGLQPPVMPVNYQHYIGIDLDNSEVAVNKIIDNPELLARVSVDGRSWALQNYSPVPTAMRFIDVINSTGILALDGPTPPSLAP